MELEEGGPIKTKNAWKSHIGTYHFIDFKKKEKRNWTEVFLMVVNTAPRSHRISNQNSSVSYGIFPYDWSGSPRRLSKHYRLLYLLLDTHHHSARTITPSCRLFLFQYWTAWQDMLPHECSKGNQLLSDWIEETLQEGIHICLHHRTDEKPVRGHMLYWRI